MWNVIEKLSDRLKSVDMVQFMSKDVVSTLHKHFQDIHEANVKYDIIFIISITFNIETISF